MTVAVHSVPASDLTNAEVERWRDIPVAVAVDVGRTKGQIDPAIRPLLPSGHQPRMFGRAVTALCEPPDFGAVLLAIDRIRAGRRLGDSGSGPRRDATIGEILSGQARRRAAVGVVCDGAIRDVATLAQWSDFSVFTRHVTPCGPWSAERGAVNAPVVFGGQAISPGDLIIGDDDGLVALDAQSSDRSPIADAEAKLRLEAEWQQSLTAGRSMAETFGLAEPAAVGKPTRAVPERSGFPTAVANGKQRKMIEEQSSAVLSALRTIATERKVLDALEEAILATGEGGLGAALSEAVKTISAAPGRVIVTGIGKSGHVARKIAATLASTGEPAFFVHPAEASHGDLGMVQIGDVVLAISWSGRDGGNSRPSSRLPNATPFR